MSKFMRMIVFFDLPVQTKTERRYATTFRNFLLKDGYHMLQFSVYARVCNGNDAVKKHESRLKASLPPNGSIRLLVVTEKQYQSIQILLGTFGKLSAGRSTVCVRTAEFFLKQKAHRTAIRCAFCIAYYTIPRAIREL